MMTDCPNVAIRERLPELVHGMLVDAEYEVVQAHVDACRDCAAEVALLRAVVVTAPTPPINVAHIAEAIPAYQPVQSSVSRVGRPASRRFWSNSTYLQIAATFMLAAVGISVVAVKQHGPASATIAHRPAASPGVALVNVGDLSDDDLEELIREMDQMDAAPPVDGVPVSSSVLSGGGV